MVFVYCSRLTDIKLLTQNKRCSRCTPQLFQGAISQCGLLGNRFLSLTLTPLHVPPNSLHHRLCNVDFQQPQSGRVICVHRLDVFKQMFSRSYINVGPQTCPITAHSPPTGMASSPLWTIKPSPKISEQKGGKQAVNLINQYCCLGNSRPECFHFPRLRSGSLIGLLGLSEEVVRRQGFLFVACSSHRSPGHTDPQCDAPMRPLKVQLLDESVWKPCFLRQTQVARW